jgi:hypothetical protein
MLRKIQKATKAEAIRNQVTLRNKYRECERTWFSLGLDVKQAMERHEPEALGLSFSEWFAETFEESDSTLWRALRSAKVLGHLPESTLNQITTVNADQLTRLPEKLRKGPESDKWVKKAIDLPTEKFKQEVNQAREQCGIKSDKFKTFSRTFPSDLYDQILEMESKLADILGVDISQRSKNQVAALIIVLEALSSMVRLTDKSHLIVEIQGG